MAKTHTLYITEEQWETLCNGGTITINGQTYSYSEDYEYFVQIPPEEAEQIFGGATNAET